MIAATQKKLREAKFFYGQLQHASKEAVRNEPEKFDFLLSAFLSAARSVTFALQFEAKAQYDAWFPGWRGGRSEQENELLKFFTQQRNMTEKRGGAEFLYAFEYVPISEIPSGNREHPAYGFHWSGPPGAPEPMVGIVAHTFDMADGPLKVISACRSYFEVLEQLVADFSQSHGIP